MTRKYVFWRNPQGVPDRRDDQKNAPTNLLSEIGRQAKLKADGSINWPFAIFFQQAQLAISSAVVVQTPEGDELNPTDSSQIIWDAIRESVKRTGGGKPVAGSTLLRISNDLAAEFYRQPVAQFTVVTTTSVEKFPARRIRVDDCELLASRKHRAKLPLPGSLHRLSAMSEIAKHCSETNYTSVKIHVSGRTVNDAADKALDALDLTRGLWTLFYTIGSWSMTLGTRKPTPIGVVHTGPLHTIHHRDMSLASDLYWIDPAYSQDRKLFTPKKGWSRIERDRRWAMARIKLLPYAADCKRLIVRYARALDNVDLDVAFLQMWSILEHLTDTVGANYDQTIKRATWLYPDQPIAKELLEHLRFQRNRYVHSATSTEEGEQIVYMIKSFVDPHLVRLIRNRFNVGSLREYGEFLSLPSDLSALQKRRAHIRQAINYKEQSRDAADA